MPHLSPIPDLLSKLDTDASAGLAPKEAQRRLETSTAAPLFRKKPRRYAECVRQTIREPALWLMITVAIISLFFNRVALAVFCLLLTLGDTALCAWFLFRADRTDATMLAYDAPLCRVLRGRRVLRLPAEGLVAGDIILLRAGDVIPADCRLLRTDGFAVLERELDATDPRRPPIRLEKDADQYPASTEGLRLSPVNMVFAGGMVDAGSAQAVVVAVGSDTHLGGLIGHIPTPHQDRPVGYFKKAAKVLSIYNLGLFCLIIPLTAIGIFTVGESYEFLDIFLSVLALSVLTLTEHLLARGIHLAAATRRAAALDRDSENSAEIKSAATLETLTAMTDLILIGTAALHDGACHPESLRVGDRLYRCDRPEADEEAQAVAEYLYLYREGMARLPSTGSEEEIELGLLTEFCRWADVDAEALRVKIKEIHPHGKGVAGTFPTPDGSRRVVVTLTPHFHEVEACSHVHDGRRVRPLDRDGQNLLYRAYREEVRQGSIPLFLLTESEGETTVRAMLTCAHHTCRKTAGCVKNLESAGIRVAAFLREESDSHPRMLAACGLTDAHPADRPAPDGMPRTSAAHRMDEGCRAFEGCSTDYIRDCITDLKAQGRTVGVLSVDGRDVSLLAEADVAFACTPSVYDAVEAGEFRADQRGFEDEPETDGTPDGRVANDRSRRVAHVLVRRCSAVGGGLLGVLRALRAADGFCGALDRTLRFLLIAQTLRALMTILPLCLGVSIASAPALLISGLLVDLLVMTAFLNLTPAPVPNPRRASDADLIRSPRAFLPELIAVTVAAVFSWLMVWIAVLCDLEFGGDLLYFGLLCTFGVQLAIFRADKLPKRDSTVFFTAFALFLVYVGALASALVGGMHLLWALCAPLVAPLVYLSVRAVALAVARKGRKG